MSRILGPFRKRVLQFAASFPVIVTQKYLSQFSKRDVWNLIPEPPAYFPTFFLVHFPSCLHDDNCGKRRLRSWKNYICKSTLSPHQRSVQMFRCWHTPERWKPYQKKVSEDVWAIWTLKFHTFADTNLSRKFNNLSKLHTGENTLYCSLQRRR